MSMQNKTVFTTNTSRVIYKMYSLNKLTRHRAIFANWTKIMKKSLLTIIKPKIILGQSKVLLHSQKCIYFQRLLL